MKNFLRSIVKNRSVQALLVTALFAAAVGIPYGLAHAAGAQPRNCDNNAIVNCGAYSVSELQTKLQNGDQLNSGSNIQAIYQSFGINTADLSQAQDGYVTKSGDVVVGGQTIATGVWTAGRQDIGNSQSHGSVWMRPPSVSFLSDQLDAFVYAPGGHFEWAILKACGNPVFPVGAPFGQIEKRVQDVTTNSQVYAADNDQQALQVNAGDVLEYYITINNNGTTDMTNTVMTDNLPQGVSLNGNPAERNITTDAFGTVPSNGGSKTFNIYVKVDSNVTNGQYICNTASFTANGGQSGSDQACVQIKIQCQGQTNCTCEQNNNCNTCQGQTNCTCEQNNNCNTNNGGHPTKPTSLPSTGPDGLVGLFAGTSGLGAVSHWFYRRRKFSR